MKYILDASVAISWVIPRPLTPKAVRLRDEYQRQIHCLYVALAEREGCPLITADQKSVNNLAPHFPFIVALATLP